MIDALGTFVGGVQGGVFGGAQETLRGTQGILGGTQGTSRSTPRRTIGRGSRGTRGRGRAANAARTNGPITNSTVGTSSLATSPTTNPTTNLANNPAYNFSSNFRSGVIPDTSKEDSNGAHPAFNPPVQTLNELLELHNDPQLDARVPPRDPNQPVIRDQREILYGKWNWGPSRGFRLAYKLRKKFHPKEIRKRWELKEKKRKEASEEQPPKYVESDYHHQLEQEMWVVIENQEAILEQMTDLLYQRDAEIERMQYDMLLASSPPNSALPSIREEEPVGGWGGGGGCGR